MRAASVPAWAAVALLLGACGASAPHHRSGAGAGGSARAAERAPRTLSARVIAVAAQRTAAQPGYTVSLQLSFESERLGGQLSASGSGSFGAAGGRAHVTLGLPGLLELMSPLTTRAVLAGGTLYVRVPRSVAAQTLGVPRWVALSPADAASLVGVSAGSLSALLSPRQALLALAAESRGRARYLGPQTLAGVATAHYRESHAVPGASLTADVWVVPRSGLLRRVRLEYAAAGGTTQGLLQVDFSAYVGVSAAPAPPASQVGSAGSLLRQLSG